MPAPVLVALSAEIPPVHTLFITLGERKAQDFMQRAAQRLAHRAAAQGGIVVRTDRSGLLALFDQAERALVCARALRRDLMQWVRPIAHEVEVHVAIGISRGRILGQPPDYEGQTLQHANALAAAAQGGQILLDAAAVQQLSQSLRETLQHVHRMQWDSGLTDVWMDPPENAQPDSATLLWLHLQRPDSGPERVVIPGRVVHIGRSSEADIVIDREDVSRRQAVVLWRDGDYTLTDLSRNGSWLQYGLSGVIVRVHRTAVVLRAAGALYFGRAPLPGQPPDLRFLVDRPGRVTVQGHAAQNPQPVVVMGSGLAEQNLDFEEIEP